MKKTLTRKEVVICLLFLIIGCQSKEKSTKNRVRSYQVTTTFSIDTLYLDLKLFSTDGYFRLIDDKIAYVQASEQNIYIFNQSGRLVNQKLGSGNGPDKANGDLSYHSETEDGQHLFLGSSYVLKTFNHELDEIQESTTINWDGRKASYNSSELSSPGLYSYHYRDEPFIDEQWLPITKGRKIIIPVVINNHRNQYTSVQENPKDYFKKGYMVGVIDLETGVIEHVFHSFPKRFSEFSGYPYFYNYTYRYVNGNEIFISDRLTPDIYVYDANSYKLKSKFGIEGAVFNPEIDHYNTYTEFLSGISPGNTLLSSYYLNLFVDDDYAFRSYHVRNFEEWALQVYDKSSKELLFETRTPFRFNIIGRYNGFYFADGIRDEETETLAIYKFKLPSR